MEEGPHYRLGQIKMNDAPTLSRNLNLSMIIFKIKFNCDSPCRPPFPTYTEANSGGYACVSFWRQGRATHSTTHDASSGS